MPVLASTLAAIKHYCAYQERSHAEVRSKLITLACYGEDLEEAIGILIEEDYLNEERFAIAYAGGKFRTHSWGRVKIKQQLKLKQVSEYCTRKALAAIGEEDYLATLKKLLEKKKASLGSEKDHWRKRQKVTSYLLQKGYEADLIQATWNSSESV